MRAVITVAALALLGASTVATAQPGPIPYPGNTGVHPVAYICTASAQVVRVTTPGGVATASVFANGIGVFDDCVVGPDGLLYVANGQQDRQTRSYQIRVFGNFADVATLPNLGLRLGKQRHSARGLAFNAGNDLSSRPRRRVCTASTLPTIDRATDLVDVGSGQAASRSMRLAISTWRAAARSISRMERHTSTPTGRPPRSPLSQARTGSG